jgi:aryl-alcohol dehydrogenase-like predicted oxidoreductase
MSLDHYVTLGRSGLRVSPFCLGCMTFGDEWAAVGTHEAESLDVLAAYLDAGGNFLDTANIYTRGHSEVIMGDYFAGSPVVARDRVVIATKFCGNMHPGDPNGGGAGRKAIIHQLEDSLRRLRTDYVDLYWCHFFDRHTPIDETMRALDQLVRDGKVRHIGLSDFPAWIVVQAQYEAIFRGWEPLIALQIEYSLAQRTVEADLLPMARALGLGVTPWSPLRAGILSGKYRRDTRPEVGTTRVTEDSPHLSERNYAIVDELIAIAEELGATPAQVALRWVQDRDGVASTIIGARRKDQLLDNLGALAITLSPEQTARLDAVSEVEHPFPHPFLQNTPNTTQGGTTVNGFAGTQAPFLPQTDAERW